MNPKSAEFQSCVAIFFVLYFSHVIAHRVAYLFPSKISYWVSVRIELK